jgi:hypothetical protein
MRKVHYGFDETTHSFGTPPMPIPLYQQKRSIREDLDDILNVTYFFARGKCCPKVKERLHCVERLIFGDVFSEPKSITNKLFAFFRGVCIR